MTWEALALLPREKDGAILCFSNGDEAGYHAIASLEIRGGYLMVLLENGGEHHIPTSSSIDQIDEGYWIFAHEAHICELSYEQAAS